MRRVACVSFLCGLFFTQPVFWLLLAAVRCSAGQGRFGLRFLGQERRPGTSLGQGYGIMEFFFALVTFYDGGGGGGDSILHGAWVWGNSGVQRNFFFLRRCANG
jgi:hypothetical protein